MKNNILTPLLGLCKSNPLFEILINEEIPNDLLVHFGTKHLETVKAGTYEEKFLIGRLFNAGFNRKALQETFNIDFKTMQSYGAALSSGDINRVRNLIFGQGARPKLLKIHKTFIKNKYRKYIYIYGCHTTSKIHEELEYSFDLEISSESVRLVINEAKEEEARINEAKEEFQKENKATHHPIKKRIKKILKSRKGKRKSKITKEKKRKKLRRTIKNRKRQKHAIKAKARNRRQQNLKNREIQRNHHKQRKEVSIKISSNDTKQEIKNNSKLEKTWNFSCSKKGENSKLSPISEQPEYNFPLVISSAKTPYLSHHLGILLSRIYIDKITKEMPKEFQSLLRQWIAMILFNCKNIENGQKLNYNDLTYLIGKQIKTANWQRTSLHEMASEELALNILRENLKFVSGDLLDTFLYDPHSIPYTGILDTLKGWLGGSHKTGKAYYQDFIHSVSGEPVFLTIDDNYADMRERFVVNIKLFRRILSGDKNRELTIIVDRAIYNLEYMSDLRKNHNINIITWEKNYVKGQWDETRKDIKKMFIQRTKNYKEDTITYQIEYVKNDWVKDDSFAQFTLLLTKPKSDPIELSIICADKNRDSEDVLYPILRRWLQENDFAFLIKLGINEITSYKWCTYESIADTLVDRNMKNKERTKLSANRLSKRKELGLALLKKKELEEKNSVWLPNLEKEIEALSNEIDLKKINEKPFDSLKKERAKLKQQRSSFKRNHDKYMQNNNLLILNLETEINNLANKISLVPSEVSRLEELIEKEFKKLNFMPKAILDCVKVIARNIIYKLLSFFRPIYNNYRNDIVLLRELINSSGTIIQSKSNVKILLHPTRNYDDKTKNKIILFLMQMSVEANAFYKTEKTLIFDLYEK